MSYQEARRQPLSKSDWLFSGGYVDNVQNVDLAPQFSPYLRNCRLDGQSIIIRPGHSLISTLTAWDYPKGISWYLRTDASNDRLIVRHNTDATHKLYSITTTWVATSIDTGANITSDNRMSFQNVNDVLYCMNWVDDFGKLEWTTYTLPSTWIADFSPSFSVIFNSSHFASGWSDNANTVYKSVGNDYEDFNSSWSDQFTFPETITGLSANLEALFYFTKNTISVTGFSDIQETAGSITYITRSLQVKEGAINQGSIVETGRNTYFLTPSNKIGMLARGANIDGFETMELSERAYKGISKIMSILDPDQTDSFGYFLQKENLIKWFLKTRGSTINDICVVFDVEKNAFLIDEQKYFYWGTNFKGNNYTISMVEPKVYQDEYAQDDEDSPIPFEYRTKEFYISDPTIKKIFRETRTMLDINELAVMTQEMYIDGVLVDSKTVDSDNITPITWGLWTIAVWTFAIGTEWSSETGEGEYFEIYILRTKGMLNKKGRKIQFRFTNGSLAWKLRLKSVNLKAEILPEITSNLTK